MSSSRDHPGCEECRYWDPIFDSNRTGYQPFTGTCQRHAPRVRAHTDLDDAEERHAYWPITACDDWCGEWDGRPWPPLEGGE